MDREYTFNEELQQKGAHKKLKLKVKTIAYWHDVTDYKQKHVAPLFIRVQMNN